MIYETLLYVPHLKKKDNFPSFPHMKSLNLRILTSKVHYYCNERLYMPLQL